MHFPTSLILSLLPVTLSCTTCQPGATKQNLHRRADTPHFNYNELTGPVDWDQFSTTCGTGKSQSPINIIPGMKVSSGGDMGNYADIGGIGFDFNNTGHTVECYYTGQNATLGGVEYELQRFHFHTPSEHRLNNQWYPLEAHFVHSGVADPNEVAVVGIFFDIKEELEPIDLGPLESDPMIARMARLLREIREEGDSVEATFVDFSGVRSAITNARKYNYVGSLTTPPCTEGINWFVSDTILTISIAELNIFKSVMGWNARDLQSGIGSTNVVEYSQQYLSKSS
ncbi:Nectarin-2 [Arthrobotrys entomopaga]|nr:Nectarin-2 [Arthrobotrys entomopaga]